MVYYNVLEGGSTQPDYNKWVLPTCLKLFLNPMFEIIFIDGPQISIPCRFFQETYITETG